MIKKHKLAIAIVDNSLLGLSKVIGNNKIKAANVMLDVLSENNDMIFNLLSNTKDIEENISLIRASVFMAFSESRMFKSLVSLNSFRNKLTNELFLSWADLYNIDIEYKFHAIRLEGIKYITLINTKSINTDQLDYLVIKGNNFCNEFVMKCFTFIDEHQLEKDNHKKFPLTFRYYTTNAIDNFKRKYHKKTIMMNKLEAGALITVMNSLNVSNVIKNHEEDSSVIEILYHNYITTDEEFDALLNNTGTMKRLKENEKKFNETHSGAITGNPKENKKKYIDTTHDFDGDIYHRGKIDTDKDGFGEI